MHTIINKAVNNSWSEQERNALYRHLASGKTCQNVKLCHL